MKLYSKNEHLMVFRRPYKGPLQFEKGDTIWTKVRSVQRDNTECFIFMMNRYHPSYERLAQEYKIMYDEEWDGSFVIPCGYVQFADNEMENKLRESWENTKTMWKEQEEKSRDC